jgi:hypothetical protein
MNTDLESDCEAVVSVSKTNRQQSRQNSTATVSKTNLSKANTATSGSSVTKNNSTQKKNDTSNFLKVKFSFIFENVFFI